MLLVFHSCSAGAFPRSHVMHCKPVLVGKCNPVCLQLLHVAVHSVRTCCPFCECAQCSDQVQQAARLVCQVCSQRCLSYLLSARSPHHRVTSRYRA